jgi:hypothetical protein
MAWTAIAKRLLVLAALSITFAACPLSADVIMEYDATSFAPTAKVGSTTFASCTTSDPYCVAVTIFFFADTRNIVPFSVVGASGYEDFTGHGYAFISDGETGQSIIANFDPNQIFVSIDQTNDGIGFGSTIGPTYPLGVYGGTPSIGSYSSYNLGCTGPCLPGDRTFSVSGFAWFCPPNTCTLGQPGPDLATDQGPLSITPVGPIAGSSFDAQVFELTSVPEPSTLLLMGSGIATFILRRKHGSSRLKSLPR